MKKNIKILVATIIFMVITLINQNVFATIGTTTKETVRLREKASTDSKTVVLLSIDKEVEVISEDGEWYKVKYKEDENTYTGYIRNDMLKVEGKEQTKAVEENVVEENKTAEETTSVENQEQSLDTVEASTEITENSKIKIKNDINIKILPSITSSDIGSIEKSAEITISEILGKWCYIETEQKSGWAMIGKIEKQEEQEVVEEQPKEEEKVEKEEVKEVVKEEPKKEETKKVSTTKMYVSSTTINVREKASTSSKIVKQLGINTEVTVIEKVDNTWSKISANGVQGYVATKYLSDKKTQVTSRGSDETRTTTEEKQEKEEKQTEKTESAEESSSSSKSGTTGNDIVEYAKNFLGTKYVHGGTSPKTGFDCSGFTQYVYKHFGYSISRTSGSQRNNGTNVSKSNLQAGDIVCFSGHVGIYVGGNKFIHAENPANGVKISSLSEKYYTSKYITARRIID